MAVQSSPPGRDKSGREEESPSWCCSVVLRSASRSWPILPVHSRMRVTSSRGGRVIRHNTLEAARGQRRKAGCCVGMSQHALRREADQRLAPLAQSLTAQQVEVLRGRRRLADLHVIACAQLQIAFYAGAGVLRPLALIAVRQQQNEAARADPTFPRRR